MSDRSFCLSGRKGTKRGIEGSRGVSIWVVQGVDDHRAAYM